MRRPFAHYGMRGQSTMTLKTLMWERSSLATMAYAELQWRRQNRAQWRRER